MTLDTGKTIRQDDIQVLKINLAEEKTEAIRHLKFNPDYTISKWESLLVIRPSGDPVRGDMIALSLEDCCYRSESGPAELELHLKKPLVAAGLSGAPVVKASTGEAVGVLLKANSAKEARAIKFETICLPGPKTKAKTETETLTYGKLYGVPFEHPVPKELEAFIFSKVFPSLSGEVDMSQDILKVKARINEAKVSVDYNMLSSCLLFSEVRAFGGKGAPRPGIPGELWRFQNRTCVNSAVTQERLEKLTSFLVTAYGDPHLFFTKDLSRRQADDQGARKLLVA